MFKLYDKYPKKVSNVKSELFRSDGLSKNSRISEIYVFVFSS